MKGRGGGEDGREVRRREANVAYILSCLILLSFSLSSH